MFVNVRKKGSKAEIVFSSQKMDIEIEELEKLRDEANDVLLYFHIMGELKKFDMDKIGKRGFMQKFDDECTEVETFSFCFYAPDGEILYATEDESEEQKEYMYVVCLLFGLSEDMENCFSTYKDKGKVIQGLKEFGFEQVEPWW